MGDLDLISEITKVRLCTTVFLGFLQIFKPESLVLASCCTTTRVKVCIGVYDLDLRFTVMEVKFCNSVFASFTKTRVWVT